MDSPVRRRAAALSKALIVLPATGLAAISPVRRSAEEPGVHALQHAEQEQLKRLMARPAFFRLHAIWRELADLRADPDSLDSFSYLPLKGERGDSMLIRLEEIESELVSFDLPDGPARSAVVSVIQITRERVMTLSRMRTSMMTRMMPPWTMTTREELALNIESRLATLLRMQRAGTISGAEAASARDTLLDRMYAWSVVEAVDRFYGSGRLPHYPSNGDGDAVTVAMTLIEARHRAAADTLAKYAEGGAPECYASEPEEYRRLMDALELRRRSLPYIGIMLEYLVDTED